MRDRVRPDWIGGALLSGGLLAALLAISQGNQWGWSSTRVIGLFVAAGCLLVAFVLVELRVTEPLVDMRAMARRPLWGASAAAFAVSFAFFIYLLLVPQIATLPPVSGYGLGLTITETGLVVLPGSLASILGGWLSGRLVGRVGARVLVALGAACAAAAYVALAIWHDNVGPIVVAVAVLGLGVGLAVPAIVNLVVRAAGELETSVSVAVNFVVRTIGGALGIQTVAALVTGAGSTAAGFPAESGFTDGFVLGALAALVALVATIAVPAPRRRPARPHGESGRPAREGDRGRALPLTWPPRARYGAALTRESREDVLVRACARPPGRSALLARRRVAGVERRIVQPRGGLRDVAAAREPDLGDPRPAVDSSRTRPAQAVHPSCRARCRRARA